MNSTGALKPSRATVLKQPALPRHFYNFLCRSFSRLHTSPSLYPIEVEVICLGLWRISGCKLTQVNAMMAEAAQLEAHHLKQLLNKHRSCTQMHGVNDAELWHRAVDRRVDYQQNLVRMHSPPALKVCTRGCWGIYAQDIEGFVMRVRRCRRPAFVKEAHGRDGLH